jgi:PAS domain S-box-containing protein
MAFLAFGGDRAATANSPESLTSTIREPLYEPIYRTILDDQTELICRYRADTTIDYVNPAYCRYFGISPQDIVNRSYQPVIYEADRAAVAQQVAKMNCQNPYVVIENRVVAQGGEVRWTQWNNRCLCDESGTIVGYQSVGRDVTQLKAIEQQLRNSEDRYRTLLETIPQLVWVAAADGLTMRDFNQRWFDFTGQTLATAQGQGWLARVHPDDVDRVLAQWAISTTQETNYEAELRLQRADGVYIWHLAKGEPTRDEQGQIVRWYGTCTDISDRKRIELEHQQADLALQELNQQLEQRVAERTASLAAANQALKQEIEQRNTIAGQLQESEQRFRRAVTDAPFPIFIHAEDGRILQVSRAVTEITGYPASEISTLQAWTELAYGEQQSPVLSNINRLYTLNHRVDEGEFEVKTRWGTSHFWLFSSAPLGQLADGTRLVISMAADVTQQKSTEASLSARLRQQAVVTQLSQTALSGIDLPSLFEQATHLIAESLKVECTKILQLQPDGQSLRLVAGTGWHPGLVGQAQVSADIHSQAGYTLQFQQPVIVKHLPTETRFQGPALLTEHQIISGISLSIPGENDRPFGVLGAHSTQPHSFTQEDINFLQSVANLLAAAIGRKQAEAELNDLNQTLEKRIRDRTQALEDVNQELKAFSYSIAHDLRAPLRAIQGFAHVLQEDYSYALDDLGQEYIRRMGSSAEYLDVLIQDLLTYSQLGRAEIKLQWIDTAAILQKVLADLAPKIAACSAQITLEGDFPKVCAHRSILRQVFNNLLSNALKFVAPGVQPQIRIWAEARVPASTGSKAQSQITRIWIQDNGIGIAWRHQHRIFNPFERLHGVETYSGTGIGLSIVHRAMQRMGGAVGVESAEHQGSRFWIELTSMAE